MKTGDIKKQLVCSDNQHVLCTFHQVNQELLTEAVEGALAAKQRWEDLPWAERAAVFLKAADLLSTELRYEMMAATMLGQGKTVWQVKCSW